MCFFLCLYLRCYYNHKVSAMIRSDLTWLSHVIDCLPRILNRTFYSIPVVEGRLFSFGCP